MVTRNEKLEFSKRLNELLDEQHFRPKYKGRQEALAKLFDVSQIGARKWLEGEAIPKHEKIIEIATRFNARSAWLEYGELPKTADGPREIQSGLRIKEIRERYNTTQAPILSKVPLISHVQAGDWSEIVDAFQPGDAEDMIDTAARVGHHAFALRIKGRSMEPTIPDGAVVIIDPSVRPENGNIVVARLEDSMEATIKRLVIDGPYRYLEPINTAFQPIQIDGDCTIVGVAVKVEIDL